MAEREIIRCDNAIDVAGLAARAFIERVVELQSAGDDVHVSLTGGTVGILTLKTLAREPDLERIDKNRLHIWWGDENCVLPAAQIAGKNLTKWFIDQAAGAAFWSC